LKIEPTYTNISNFDADWCLDQCYQIINTCPIFEKSNNSGKFFRNYHTYRFYIDSEIPIIKKFVETLNNFSEIFCTTYPDKQYYLGYVYLAHTINSNEKICVWHKDKTYFDGQFHITVKGNAKIKVQDGSIESKIYVDNGTVWYLNGSKYLHTIESSDGERFELLAPNAPRKRGLDLWKNGASNTPERWINPQDPDIINNRKRTRSDHKYTLENWSGREKNIDGTWELAVAEFTESPKLEQKFVEQLNEK